MFEEWRLSAPCERLDHQLLPRSAEKRNNEQFFLRSKEAEHNHHFE